MCLALLVIQGKEIHTHTPGQKPPGPHLRGSSEKRLGFSFGVSGHTQTSLGFSDSSVTRDPPQVVTLWLGEGKRQGPDENPPQRSGHKWAKLRGCQKGLHYRGSSFWTRRLLSCARLEAHV